jgi:uncharacterized protein YjbI with pentapeptide repeats
MELKPDTEYEPGLDLRRFNWEKAHVENSMLPSVNLSGVTNFKGAHFEGATLTDAHFEGATLTGAHFEGATLRGAHFEGATLRGAHFYSADLTDAKVNGAFLNNTIFRQCTMKNVNFSEAIMDESTIFEGTNLEEAIFAEKDLSYINFTGAKLIKADLTNTTLEYTNFTGAKLIKADLTNAIIDNNTNFLRADLTDASLNGIIFPENYDTTMMILNKVKLIGATLHRAKFFSNSVIDVDFTGADLSGSLFYGQTLNGANFTKANLTNVNLKHIDLIHSIFEGAILNGTKVTERQAQLFFTDEQVQHMKINTKISYDNFTEKDIGEDEFTENDILFYVSSYDDLWTEFMDNGGSLNKSGIGCGYSALTMLHIIPRKESMQIIMRPGFSGTKIPDIKNILNNYLKNNNLLKEGYELKHVDFKLNVGDNKSEIFRNLVRILRNFAQNEDKNYYYTFFKTIWFDSYGVNSVTGNGHVYVLAYDKANDTAIIEDPHSAITISIEEFVQQLKRFSDSNKLLSCLFFKRQTGGHKTRKSYKCKRSKYSKSCKRSKYSKYSKCKRSKYSKSKKMIGGNNKENVETMFNFLDLGTCNDI